ncbi:hypothetical protein GUJ93_ZPchr0013g37743 [Zizania palustris]|uniref:Uncharacterized protein n=1 Tax=Zizania palustris TaxID=103762 RepID=A0A8J5WYF6_ZIZPA|nr:hypothetical protein GUJ93_ZPchr0013g37743 [Zizania palustris]
MGGGFGFPEELKVPMLEANFVRSMMQLFLTPGNVVVRGGGGEMQCECVQEMGKIGDDRDEAPGNPRTARGEGRAAMAKNRSKKNKANKGGGASAMDISEGAPAASTAVQAPEPMDTSEGKQPSLASAALSSINRKIKKGMQIKRSQNMRKIKAVARAISKNEKAEEKVLKAKSKKSRVQSAKSLYD